MAFLVEDKERLVCNMCNMVVLKLVPLYDHDQKHTGIQCCVKCKRKIKNGEEIVKFSRKNVDEDVNAFVAKMFPKPKRVDREKKKK